MLEKNLQIRIPLALHNELEIQSRNLHMRSSTLARLILLQTYKDFMILLASERLASDSKMFQQRVQKDPETDIWQIV